MPLPNVTRLRCSRPLLPARDRWLLKHVAKRCQRRRLREISFYKTFAHDGFQLSARLLSFDVKFTLRTFSSSSSLAFSQLICWCESSNVANLNSSSSPPTRCLAVDRNSWVKPRENHSSSQLNSSSTRKREKMKRSFAGAYAESRRSVKCLMTTMVLIDFSRDFVRTRNITSRNVRVSKVAPDLNAERCKFRRIAHRFSRDELSRLAWQLKWLPTLGIRLKVINDGKSEHIFQA